MKRRTSLVVGIAALSVAGTGLRQLRRKPLAVPMPGTLRVLDGETIHYVERGSGPAIVFIHGFGGSTASWRFAIDHFSQSYRVVAVDLPGFGWSSRDATLPLGHADHARRITRLMDELGIERATIVGHSMGGGVALRVAAAYPERVERLVLAAPVDPNSGGTWQRAARRMWGLNLIGPMMERNPTLVNRMVRSALRQMSADPAWVDDDVVGLYARPLAQPGTSRCLVRLAACAQDDPAIDLATIRVPTLVVCGAADNAIPGSVGEAIAASIPGARLEMMESAHLLIEEHPEQFNALVAQFLGESSTVE